MTERIIEYVVPAGTKTVRADKIFAAQFDDISRARLQRAFEAGQVSFDGMTIDKRFKVNQPGLLRAVLEEPSFDAAPTAVDLPLEVIYEDESIIVVNKAAGMITHPGNGTGDNTLVHALLYHCGENLSSVGAPDRPGIVHRLDKDTSGLIVVAKNDAAHHKLAEAFSERKTFKRYTALVFGIPKTSRGTIKEPIGRHPVMRTRMAVVHSGKPAHTDWHVEARYGQRATRMSCVIHSGRTHQIRVHMSELRFPLLGDTTYGFKPGRLKDIEIPRVMLHSTELRIQHPERDEWMTFEAPLPADFEAVMAQLAQLAS
ncbi:MAG: RluA family pseudouridine synthase [Puniceicoccaceae bacterium]|nr:RluA family pseudouridine synthase [Puniceicoccaceae bacterium]MBL6912029.1 RluA family pseudouridine synthase [Puniceicoccaceae bacterium]